MTRRWVRRTLVVVGIAVLAPLVSALGILVLVPPPLPDFEPQPWRPGAAANVAASTLLPTPIGAELDGPEDILVMPDGTVLTGDRSGRLWRLEADGGVSLVADVGGRPLGLALAADGTVLVANHGIGLQRVSADGDVTVLADTAGGTPIALANELAVHDGVVYLTDSSARYTSATIGPDAPSYLLPDLLEGRPTGRVIAHDLATGRTEVLASGLHFPNGVVVADDGRSLWVAESTRYRLVEIDLLTGERRTLLDNLPGVPDNLTATSSGGALVAVYDRTAALDGLVLPFVLGRQLLARAPTSLLVSDDSPLGGGVLVLDPNGVMTESYTGLEPAPTTVVPHDGAWYLGSLLGSPVRRVDAPTAPRTS